MELEKYKNSVFSLLKKLPDDKVISYGQLAGLVGLKSARNVSWILRKNNQPDKVPCSKVVRSDGHLAEGYKFGGKKAQRKKLKNSGITFDQRDRVEKKHFIKGD